jgi:CheY-like chemotaxis protein
VLALAPDQPCYRILVVEDHADNCQLFRNVLSPIGLAIREAYNGQEALRVWEHWQPHLIWMDLRMPVMDGYEATRRIRQKESSRRADPAVEGARDAAMQRSVIIALSASSLEHERLAALSVGCDGFLAKPFRQADIFELMRKHLGVRYVYEETSAGKTPGPQEKKTPSLTDLAALPPEILHHLEHAALRSDVELITRCLEGIRAINPPLAESLSALANNFAYGEILKLIQKIEHLPVR